jgi:hypothetical protein
LHPCKEAARSRLAPSAQYGKNQRLHAQHQGISLRYRNVIVRFDFSKALREVAALSDVTNEDMALARIDEIKDGIRRRQAAARGIPETRLRVVALPRHGGTIRQCVAGHLHVE